MPKFLVSRVLTTVVEDSVEVEAADAEAALRLAQDDAEWLRWSLTDYYQPVSGDPVVVTVEEEADSEWVPRIEEREVRWRKDRVW